MRREQLSSMEKPFYINQPLNQSFDSTLSESKDLLSKLSSDGFRISSSCRFSIFIQKFEKFIKTVKGGGSLKNFDLTLLAEGNRDFSELRDIVKSEKVKSNNRREIQELIGGASFPSDDTLTRSRDLQFQLYLAAIMDLSGFDIEIDEPDFLFNYKGLKYSVAAKRINSINKIHTRFSKAKKQIKAKGYNGFIAFSLDRIVWDEMGVDYYLVTQSPDNLYSAGQTILNKLLRTKVKKAAWDNRDPKVVGHIASLTIPALIPQLQSLGFSSIKLFIPSIDVDKENPIYKHIQEMPKLFNWF